MTSTASGSTWALRAHAACDWVLWAMTLNLLWIAFTLAGAIVLGAAPAAVAAAHLTRRRLRGDAFPTWREFGAVWRREFVRANVVVLPAMIVSVLLVAQALAAAEAGALMQPLNLFVAAAAVGVIVLTGTLVPLYVHYDLPLRSYLVTTSRWLVANLAHGLLLAAAATAVVTASAIVPGLIPFLSIGGWLAISTALCVAFFTANDRAVAERSADASAPTRAAPADFPRPTASAGRHA